MSVATNTVAACRWDAMRTLSSTVDSRNSVVAWNVRAIPRRQISEGRRPDTRAPLKTISPEDSGSTPVSRLKTVLFPAPFGPIRPWIVRGATVMEGRVTACRPPKRLLTPRRSRSNARSYRPGLGAATPVERARDAARQRHQPLREHEHDDHEHRPVDEDFVVVQLAEELGGDREHERADDRAPHRLRAANDREDDQQHHRLQTKVTRVQHLVRVRKEDAGQAGEEATEHEHPELVADDVDAERLSEQVTLADGARHQAEARVLEPNQHGGRDETQHVHQPVLRELPGEPDRAAAERQPVRARDLDEAP